MVALTPPAEFVTRAGTDSRPIVLVDATDGEALQVPCVVIDHEAAAALAVQHLSALGHRAIALVDYGEDLSGPAAPSRRRGFRRALAEAGLPAVPHYEHVVDFEPEVSMGALDALLALPEPPTAIFAGSDVLAIGLLDGARRRGRRIPDDLAVVGYGDGDADVAEYLGLTTVQVPLRAAGRRGAELLLERLQQAPGEPPARICLPAELAIRRSCGAAHVPVAGQLLRS